MSLQFQEFIGTDILTEPSGITELEKDRFLAVSDSSPDTAFYLLAHASGALTAKHLQSPPNMPKVDDLEGVVLLGEYMYAITSYSASDPKIRHLIRFQMDADGFSSQPIAANGDYELKKRIKQILLTAFPKLNSSDFSREKFNIEGLAIHKDKKELLIGLRGPTMGGKAFVVSTEGLLGAFETDASAIKINENKENIYALKLGGGGIRAMTCMADNKGYLIVSGKSINGDEKFKCPYSNDKAKFLLWYWKGSKNHEPEPIHCFFPIEENGIVVQPEGIALITLDGGEQTLLIVSDDGKKPEGLSSGRPGRYWIVEPERYRNFLHRL
ncbi:MAG: hypothetical protein OI74_03440 [Gammaproteobacteria bacterium (ex Lamellibrachia satsuma)]|nr:MAG: DUF3616 domain-containing protein [Gammaproteobacteria bacterium (ex Lamellibrachia satsuma)]RRS35138.1 MAG: hypothetical protein OI74_03440 [Gammaproteobacteria bacterium (ex Lamellibrachia satsuma)]